MWGGTDLSSLFYHFFLIFSPPLSYCSFSWFLEPVNISSLIFDGDVDGDEETRNWLVESHQLFVTRGYGVEGGFSE